MPRRSPKIEPLTLAGKHDTAPVLRVQSKSYVFYRRHPRSPNPREGVHAVIAKFDVRTGKLVDGPISADVPRYEVRVVGDTVYVKR